MLKQCDACPFEPHAYWHIVTLVKYLATKRLRVKVSPYLPVQFLQSHVPLNLSRIFLMSLYPFYVK